MSDEISRRARHRALLTETLPYEVPVIFSNDRLFASKASKKTNVDANVKSIVEKIQFSGKNVTKPYFYNIVKDSKRRTTLGVIHPVTQGKISTFYEAFSQPILSSCADSEFSLRKPDQETPLFSESELSGETTFKFGIPHIDPEEGELDVAHMNSYFSYAKYNLLGKFIESDEFRRLEKRFKHLKMIDVSRCFFNIYTHSIGWAIKGKDFCKSNRSSFSFESKFDEIMQSSNYGETNGIVVGPEISKIFAEIIFQDIDKKVASEMLPALNNRDYAVRRYVDDFYIFANTIDKIDTIMDIIVKNLEDYKLFVNDSKTSILSRPFVSPISLARSEIGDVIAQIYDITDQIVATQEPAVIAGKARSLRAKADEIRRSCGRHGIALNNVSGWVLSNLKNVLTKIIRHARNFGVGDGNALYRCISAIFEIIFYVCAVDLRVRTTYILCQCLSLVDDLKKITVPDVVDRVFHFLSEEMSILVRNALALTESQSSGVEMANILISGQHYIGVDFIRTEAARDALNKMTFDEGISYFRYITVKFCCRDNPIFTANLNEINRKAISHLNDESVDIQLDCEAYLLFCDILSSPDLTISDKAKIYRDQFGGNPSNANLEKACRSIGFVDWEGTTIQHSLARKALRPVYTWS